MKNYLPTFASIWSKLKSFVQNRYEAATSTWGNRRLLWGAYRDMRFDVNSSSSMEICRKHLDLIANTPLVQKIRNLKIQFSVGVDGLLIVPNASDPFMDKKTIEAWNEARTSQFEQWSRRPELGSNLSLQELTIQWEGMLFDVGNVIIHKTRDELGRPRIQTIDRLRLQTPTQFAKEEGKTVLDGIRLKKIVVPCRKLVDGKMQTVQQEVVTGKPESYYIRDEFDLNSFCEIPADQIIHKFRAIRPGQMVGIPEGFSVINTLIDYTDLHILEMAAAKEAGKLGVVETNATGELDALASRRVRLNIQTQNAAGTAVTKTADGFYQVEYQGSKIAMRHGDKLENFQIKRPDVCQQNYWELKRSEICIGYNVPMLLVMPYSLQGTVTRADLDVCAHAFLGDFEIISSIVREIYEWQTQWEVDYGRSMDGKRPANYLSCTIMPPRAPNVDIGYTAETLAKELEIGIKTFPRECASRNLNWREVLRENAEFQAFKNELAKEFGIEPNSISFTQFQSGKDTSIVDPENPNAGIESVAAEFNAYGIGVRAGAVTPNDEDENHFRSKLGLPKINANVRRAWNEDKGVRRPITLADSNGDRQSPGKQPAETETEKQEA